MISAFGVEHGEISKGLSPKQLAGLGNAQGRAAKLYAKGRLALHDAGPGNHGAIGRVKSNARRNMKNGLSQASPFQSYGKTVRPRRELP